MMKLKSANVLTSIAAAVALSMVAGSSASNVGDNFVDGDVITPRRRQINRSRREGMTPSPEQAEAKLKAELKAYAERENSKLPKRYRLKKK